MVLIGIAASVALRSIVAVLDGAYPYWLLVICLILIIGGIATAAKGRTQEKERVRKALEERHRAGRD
ncbi:hypothetical protein AGMMS49983_03120 [Clostridia bacterium]|nr:hypothetical protein AGMMS49983_03120 [Clostridia bacterium]